MKKEFVVERQGKHFVLYAGLLDLAHEQGLKSITTSLVQVPNETNKFVAICTATVVIEKDGIERTFTGIGDAAPNNVAPAMQTALIRMSETRSKARALRDAVNVGVAALEEVDEFDSVDSAPESGYQTGYRGNARQTSRSRSTSAPRQAAPVAANNKPRLTVSSESDAITDQQQEAIRNLCQRRDLVMEAVLQEKCQQTNLAALTQEQARDLIRTLNQRQAKPAAA